MKNIKEKLVKPLKGNIILCCGVIVSLVLYAVILFGCAGHTDLQKQIYQPNYLVLPAQKSVQTKEGVYTPQQEETWVSTWKYQALERENLILTNALKQAQASKEISP